MGKGVRGSNALQMLLPDYFTDISNEFFEACSSSALRLARFLNFIAFSHKLIKATLGLKYVCSTITINVVGISTKEMRSCSRV